MFHLGLHHSVQGTCTLQPGGWAERGRGLGRAQVKRLDIHCLPSSGLPLLTASRKSAEGPYMLHLPGTFHGDSLPTVVCYTAASASLALWEPEFPVDSEV